MDGSEEHCNEHVEAASFKCLPASVRKMDTKSSNSCEESTEEESERNDGFRIIDISILASVFECLRCPECQQSSVVFEEDPDSKMGLASKFILKCSSRKCFFASHFLPLVKLKMVKLLK